MGMNILKEYQGLLVLSWVYGVSFFSVLFMVMSAGRLAYEMGYIALATLPMGLQYTGIMFGAIPVSKVLMRYGARTGFIIMQCVGLLSSILLITTVQTNSFTLLLVSSFLMGVFIASNHQIRYMASDTVSKDKKNIAISAVLASSIVGGFMAGTVANASSALSSTPFLGVFYMHFFMLLLGMLALVLFKIPVNKIIVKDYNVNFSLLKKDGVTATIIITAISYSSMTFLMTAVPIVMNTLDISIFSSNTAIGYHALGMSVPSLFVGYLISKTSAKTMVRVGATIFMLMVYIHLFIPSTVFSLTFGLILLGIGWCSMFISGTTMLTKLLEPQERLQIQGFVDFCVFSLTALGALGAGIILHFFGWQGANMIVFMGAVVVFGLTLTIEKGT